MRLRACGCSFCLAHNTRTTSDPDGSVEIWWSFVAPDVTRRNSSRHNEGAAQREGRMMKRLRFTEEQIIAVLREQEAGIATAAQARGQLGDVLQVEGQVRRVGGVRGQAASGTGG